MAENDNNLKGEYEMDIFEIDLNRLEKEWQNQPQLFYDASVKLADSKEYLERAKAKSDVTRAETERIIRGNPEKFSITKVTEGAISTALTLHPDVVSVAAVVIEAKHEVDINYAMVNALEHRKSALEKLVALHGQNYFSTPVAKDDDVQEFKKTKNRRIVRKRREETEGDNDE